MYQDGASATDELLCQRRTDKYCEQPVKPKTSVSELSVSEKVNWSCNHDHRPCVGAEATVEPVDPIPEPKCIEMIVGGYNNYKKFTPRVQPFLDEVRAKIKRLEEMHLMK